MTSPILTSTGYEFLPVGKTKYSVLWQDPKTGLWLPLRPPEGTKDESLIQATERCKAEAVRLRAILGKDPVIRLCQTRTQFRTVAKIQFPRTESHVPANRLHQSNQPLQPAESTQSHLPEHSG